jgi:oxygen-independent coproporphyrinogen-3 oxidase
MIQKGSALFRDIDRGDLAFDRGIASDRERHNLFLRRLTESGFTLLELTKLARPGRDAYRYIRIQYENGDLVPIGSGAGGRIAGFQIYSMAPGKRFVNAGNADYDRYYRLLGELQFGVYDPARMSRFLGPVVEAAITEKMRELSGAGLLTPVPESTAWTLSPDGIFWGNNIAVEVLAAAITAKRGEHA